MDNSLDVITRTFQLDKQTCLLHLPEKPNGFLILYLGDAGHYVEEHQSFWSEHPERASLLNQLLENGYTLFTSQLYGNGWGSPKTTHLLHQVLQFVRRQEIVNPHIHVIAEGMGALTALRWQENHDISIRSFVFFTPCLSMKALFDQERSNQVFFKRLKKELASAYDLEEKNVEKDVIQPSSLPQTETPALIFHDVSCQHYSVHEHSRRFEEEQHYLNRRVELKLAIHPILPRVTTSILRFMKEYETTLSSSY
ncbi:hypothetical protein GLW08_05675 [Pontibacillus yanchengensis]|uniref:Uncharacterized protein n=2 Tax=Pontibacillus yanchengensis TaxID=462910 RepID=A0ACC7VFE5_9BACI|nr:hypothetical protein [Pontibacillus yanchengensis]MYL32245.1 hypothetical protein [Pontibacillus yanchengensis]MYL52825.1 hypothetical protein [Pontibacillus yanchengensis]